MVAFQWEMVQQHFFTLHWRDDKQVIPWKDFILLLEVAAFSKHCIVNTECMVSVVYSDVTHIEWIFAYIQFLYAQKK